MTGHRAATSLLAAAAAAGALALGGCGGGEEPRAAGESAAGSTVEVVEASFPAEQGLGGQAQMRITVKNTGAEPLADVAVTIDSFSRRSSRPGEADPERPVWIVDEAPRGATTALTNTWALAGLRSGRTKTFRWRVTPVEAGSYRVAYAVGAGLDQTAEAGDPADESRVRGTFRVRVSDTPSAARVDPETGRVERLEK